MAESKGIKPGAEASAPKRRGRPPGKRSAVTAPSSGQPAKAAEVPVSVSVAATKKVGSARPDGAPKPSRQKQSAVKPAAPATPVAPVVTKSQPEETKIAPATAKQVEARAAVFTAEPPESEKMTEAENFLKNAAATAEATTAKVSSMFNDFSDRSKSAMTKGSKLMEECADLTKGNLEAVSASSRAAAKGAETLAQGMAEYGRKNFEEATKALKSFTAAKTPTEAFQLQSEFAKSAFDSMVAEASRVSETVVKIWGDVVEPLSSRAAVATDKVRSAIK